MALMGMAVAASGIIWPIIFISFCSALIYEIGMVPLSVIESHSLSYPDFSCL